jgi:hypothetical protein
MGLREWLLSVVMELGSRVQRSLDQKTWQEQSQLRFPHMQVPPVARQLRFAEQVSPHALQSLSVPSAVQVPKQHAHWAPGPQSQEVLSGAFVR